MGVGIWSMHFIGMLAFSLPGIDIYYDIPLLLLSILVAIIASAIALYIISTKEKPTSLTYTIGSLVMGTAIAGMHYIGIWSMRMNALIEWNYTIVGISYLIAVFASCGALLFAFKLRGDVSVQGFVYRGIAGTLMGFAIAGMHYTGMAAMTIIPADKFWTVTDKVLATDGLATAVIIGTIFILSIALTGSNIDRALSRKTMMNDALKDAIRARDEFMSVASHELRTPLTSIKLQNEMILRSARKEGADVNKLIKMIEKTDTNLLRINRLIDDMLDISRFSTGRVSLQKESFDLGQLTQEVIERLSPLMEEAGTPITFENVRSIEGEWDRFRIEQVITNLLTNAAKYASGKPIKIIVEGDNTWGIVRVRDNGKGIAKEDHERIFMRFERANIAPNLRGMGLGLFIVREIVSLHGGTIHVESEIDKGSEFIVKLPKQPISS